MNILITNDDGWGFVGIERLTAVAKELGNVWVVAPEKPMSGISHQMTFERPMSFVEKAPQSFSLDGTPADCVRVAMTQLDVDFDWVFSGINKGANLGSDIYVSGTVAAAREASLFNVRAIAFSQHLRNFKSPFDWDHSEEVTKTLLPELLKRKLEQRTWLNVNIPDVELIDLKSDDGQLNAVDVQNDRNPLPAKYAKRANGDLLYNAVYNDRERTPGCDIDVCFSGKISITTHTLQ